MKHSKKILMYSVYAMILGAVLAGAAFLSGAKINGIVLGKNGAQVLSTEKHTMNKDNLAKFDSLDLDINTANVSLIPSDHYGADFVYYGDNSTYSCKVENSTLKISTNEKRSYEIVCLNITPVQLSNTLDIYYPKNARLKNLKINNKDGNFASSGLTADEAHFSLPYGSLYLDGADCGNVFLDLQNGKCRLKDVKATALNYKNKYGNGMFENTKVSKDVKMLSSDGSMTINNISCGSLEAESSYGNIDLDSVNVSELNSTLKDGNLSVKNSSIGNSSISNSYGRVFFDNVRSNGAKIKCRDGEININGELKGKTDLSSDYGKVSVKTSLPKDKYSYTAVSKDGNVEIDGQKCGMNITNSSNAKNAIYAQAKDGDVSVSFGSK